MADAWQDRHPFKVGQTVFAREAHVLGSYGLFLKPHAPYLVRMRGEDGHGLWLAVEGVVEQLPERLFADVPVMAPARQVA